MPWARASALFRHLECPAASEYPRAERGAWRPGYLATEPLMANPAPPPDDDSVLAKWGTEMHKAKEGHPEANDLWLTTMDPHRERYWPAALGRHEVPVSYDCRTRTVEVGLQVARGDQDRWKESRGVNCVTGTTDWWGRLPGGEPWVDDLKTGWAPPQVLSPQMLFYALVASRHEGAPQVRVSVTHWRRDWDEPERKWQVAGPVLLQTFEDELIAAWQRAIRREGPKAGAHCRFCPSLGVCPAGNQLTE
jgi:hypothetical protein